MSDPRDPYSPQPTGDHAGRGDVGRSADDEFVSEFDAELAVAAIWRAAADDHEDVPAMVRARLAADADEVFRAAPRPAVRGLDRDEPTEPIRLDREQARRLTPPPNTAWTSWIGWGVAAVLAIGVIAALASRPGNVAPPTVATAPTFAEFQQAGLSATSLDTVSLEDQYASADAEVVWDDAKQAGVLRVRKLPANVPTAAQYQLWIVDGKRPAELNRVDGGVFDVKTDGSASSGSDWIEIPIDAKLPVGKAAGFAITLEEPGGTIVSDLGPRLLMIKVL